MDHAGPIKHVGIDGVGDMERETGIEPATSSLGSWRSTAELLPLAGKDAEYSPLSQAKFSTRRRGKQSAGLHRLLRKLGRCCGITASGIAATTRRRFHLDCLKSRIVSSSSSSRKHASTGAGGDQP